MARVDGVAVVTVNLASSLAFYRLLGIDAPPPIPGERYACAVNHGLRLSWSDAQSAACGAPAHRPEHALPGCRLVLRCSRPAEVDALAEAVAEAGHAVLRQPFDAPWAARVCRVLDPDGNTVELFAPLP
jgi:predicted enzyme related to lactoylglutathione lyase